MTLLIALEFNHTLQYVVTRERGIIPARTVLLIAQRALARRVIVADLSAPDAAHLAAFAALAIALAIAYSMTRPDDEPAAQH